MLGIFSAPFTVCQDPQFVQETKELYKNLIDEHSLSVVLAYALKINLYLLYLNY